MFLLLLVVVLVPILVRLADLAMLALLATTGLVLLYLVIGGIGMLVIWASVGPRIPVVVRPGVVFTASVVVVADVLI
jgi:hypothetical protein